MRKYMSLCAALLVTGVGRAQTPASANKVSLFRPLELPAPNATRDAAGRPGPKYWQQRVNYAIDARLDTTTQTISGSEQVTYVNHSPDTLRFVWFQLDQNLYRPDSRGAARFPGLARGGGPPFKGGYEIDAVFESARSSCRGGDARAPRIDGTLMRVDLLRALPPGDSICFRVAYHFEIPEHGSDRMGRTHYESGWMYGIAQWYPRLAVYDDVRGWNLDEYLGQGEFYLEYGDFDVAVTVPRGFIVAGPGTLLNAAEVLTSTERTRLAYALTSDTAVAIIARQEAGTSAARPAGNTSTLTWRFHAQNVRDFAWAASPAFLWSACGWHNVLMQSFYEPDADPDWARGCEYVRNTIRLYSEKWALYPYPTAISVAGPNVQSGGMEYPMLVFDPSRYGGRALRSVTLHEMGHQWFPMMVGSNERRYAWMDEGLDTFINDADDWSDLGGFPSRGNGDGWVRAINAGRDGIPMTPSDSLPSAIASYASYRKPAMGLYLVRHQIAADTNRFDDALRQYIREWSFKHPTPADFFRVMNAQLGLDLDWFWRGWFYHTDHLDLGIDSVTTSGSASARTAHVFLVNRGALPMPVPVRLTFDDGTTRDARVPVDVWRTASTYRLNVSVRRVVVSAEIDPDHNLPDIARSNNVWRSQTR